MEKINFPKRFRVYLPLIALFLILVFMMPKSPQFNYDYRKGSPWMYETLIAQFDFPILKTETQLLAERERAGSNVIPYYKLDAKIASKSIGSVSSLDLGRWSDLRVPVSDALSYLYSKGILAPSVGVDLSEANHESEGLIYVQKNRRAEKIPMTEVFTIETASAYLRDVVSIVKTSVIGIFSALRFFWTYISPSDS